MISCAYVWVLLGVGQLEEIPANRPGVFHLTLSGELRGWIWLAPAILAVLTCLSRRASWIGIMVLFAPAVFSMASYAESWAAYKIPGGSTGYDNGWYQAAIYLGAMLIPVLAALFPSPPVVEVNTQALQRRRSR